MAFRLPMTVLERKASGNGRVVFDESCCEAVECLNWMKRRIGTSDP
jgi:hypothetical protein